MTLCAAVVPNAWEHVASSGAAAGRARPWQVGIGLPSSLNDTLPVGDPDPGASTATVAV